MLCQLSYASRGVKSRAIDRLSRLPAEVKIASAPQKIYHRTNAYPNRAGAASAGNLNQFGG
jgi:hypothetical protein